MNLSPAETKGVNHLISIIFLMTVQIGDDERGCFSKRSGGGKFAGAGHLRTISTTVTSGGARNRMGGPQVPVPRLTWRRAPSGMMKSPL